MPLDDAIGEPAETSRLRSANDRLRRELAAVRGHARRLSEAVDAYEEAAVTAARLSAARIPKWVAGRKPRRNEAILGTIWSDSHFDEIVRNQELGGRAENAYDRHIATLRWHRYIEELVAIKSTINYSWQGIVFMLGGDLSYGNIHDELRETAHSTMPDMLAYWLPVLASGITRLADTYGNVHVPVVVGNHGRLTRKSRAKLRALDNWDSLTGRLLEQSLAADKRITFQVPEAADAIVHIYGTRFLLTHGDQASGGAGGAYAAVKRLKEKKHATYDFDWLVCGHFHTYLHGQGVIVNGSAKGTDEYALTMAFAPEPPMQAAWVVTPERGVTHAMPIFVADRSVEGW